VRIEPFKLTGLALAFFPLAFAPSALAQSHAAAWLKAGTLEVPCNKSQVVSADRPIAKAMVGSADIADVLPITDHSLYVLGKKAGTTSLTLYDRGGRVISVMDVAVGPDVEALVDRMHELLPGEDVDAHIANDSIVLTGTVDSAGAASRAAQLAQAFVGGQCAGSGAAGKGGDADQNGVINLINLGSSQQVMLEVRFAEVNRTAERQLGLNSSALSRNGSFGAIIGPGSGFVPPTVGTTSTNNGVTTVTGAQPGFLSTTGITGAFAVLSQRFSVGSLGINAMLNALESKGFAKTLDQPTLVALSGEKASFLAGGEFPVPVVQSGSGAGGNAGISVQFKPFGVSLAFTATVLGDRTINMLVEPEVSEIDSTAAVTINGISIPGLRTRRASTTLEMRDGESFAIAGLLQKDFKTTVNQFPGLGAIPILGALFRSTDFQKNQTELLIVVTPHLVAAVRPDQVRLPTDELSDPRASDLLLYGEPYRPKKLQPTGPSAPHQPPATVAAPLSSTTVPAISGAAASGTKPGNAPPPPGIATNGKEDGYAN